MADKKVNRVSVNGQVIIDLSSDTVSSDTLMSGFTAHDKSGNQIVGTAAGAKEEQVKSINPSTTYQTVYPDSGKVLSAVNVYAIQTESKTVKANGTVTPTSGKYLASVVVDIPVYDGEVEYL